VEALGRDLTAARAQLDAAKAEIARATAVQVDVVRAKQTVEAAIIERDQALTRERERAEALARDLASALAQMQGLKAEVANVTTIHAQVSQAKQAAEAAVAGRDQGLARERDRANALARELTAARAQIEDVKAQAAMAEAEAKRVKAAGTEHEQAVARERERADGFARDLSKVHAELQALKAPPVALAPAIKVATIRVLHGTDSSSAREPAAAAQTVASANSFDLKLAMRSEPSLSPPDATRSVPRQGGASSEPLPISEEDARALARAEALIRQGDIKGARLVLERATTSGSPRAWFTLAETYDPRMLSAWRTFGIRGEPEKARELYGRAYAAGIIEAKERGETLK
jgi:hypothetical protein